MMKQDKDEAEKNFSDLMIHLSECLEEVDEIKIDWRVLKKYCDDWFLDNKIEVKLKCLI